MERVESKYIIESIKKSIAVKEAIIADSELIEAIRVVSEEVIAVLKSGGKILTAGNGGSAADAQHIAAEFVSRFYFDRPALAAIALTTDSSIITAIGNDYGYENLFTRQLEALGRKGDLYIAISTSGNSPNIIKSLAVARQLGVTTVGLTGESGGKMAGECDHLLNIPSGETPRIQEAHITIGHILCALAEAVIFKG